MFGSNLPLISKNNCPELLKPKLSKSKSLSKYFYGYLPIQDSIRIKPIRQKIFNTYINTKTRNFISENKINTLNINTERINNHENKLNPFMKSNEKLFRNVQKINGIYFLSNNSYHKSKSQNRNFII